MPALMLNGVNYSGVGGGGNANEQVLTWAEYCALTPEEKMNDTTYYVNDINGDGQSFQPVIFSFEEREIGVYGDGKPLYSRTFAKTIASSPDADSSSFLVASNIDYVDTLVNIWGSVCRPEGDAYAGSTGLIMAGGWQYSFHINPSHQLVVWTGDSSSYYRSIAGGNVVVTIQYTKTTDQPGSGTWTPQGIPAVHYSTDEHVVGTWINGKTVYEQTIIGNAISDTGINILWERTDIDTVVEYNCIFLDDNDLEYNANYYYSTGAYFRVFVDTQSVWTNTKGVVCQRSSNQAINGTRLTVRYTKSTS